MVTLKDFISRFRRKSNQRIRLSSKEKLIRNHKFDQKPSLVTQNFKILLHQIRDLGFPLKKKESKVTNSTSNLQLFSKPSKSNHQ